MKMRKMIMKTLAAALILTMLFAGTAWASPEFTRSEEEWARLRDNTLEFDEIDALINEYNATVKNNGYSLEDFRKKYGKSNSEIRDAYLEIANELLAQTDYSDAASTLMSISLDSQAKSAQASADESLEDYEQYRLTYESAEKSLAQSAKLKMIAYYNAVLAAEKAGLSAELSESELNVLSVKRSIGMATAAEILTAQEKALSARQTALTAQTDIDTVKRKLQVLCGWKYEDDPEIAALPAPDMARVVDPAADLRKALDNNYTIRINERKLSYAEAGTTKDSLTLAINSNRQNAAISLNNLAANIDAAKKAYNYASVNLQLQEKTLSNLRAKRSAGTASAVELSAQEKQTRIAQIALQEASNGVLEAYTAYDYAVDGLAGA